MSDAEFWRTQPKRLKALMDVHNRVHSVESLPDMPKGAKGAKRAKSGFRAARPGYIDQVL